MADRSIYWIAPALGVEDQKILAFQINAWLSENHGRIPYSVAPTDGIKFKDNVWVGNEPGQGLTCATFVVELFHDLGIPFIDVDTWEPREGDRAWAENILKCFDNMTEEHKSAQLDRIGDSVRISPADVFAAGMLLKDDNVPLDFSTVCPHSAEVENTLIQYSTRSAI